MKVFASSFFPPHPSRYMITSEFSQRIESTSARECFVRFQGFHLLVTRAAANGVPSGMRSIS
jgi:hypothetical protein